MSSKASQSTHTTSSAIPQIPNVKPLSLLGPPSPPPAAVIPAISFSQTLSEDDMLEQLNGIFVQLKAHDIKFALRRAKGDFQKAVDDLLNIQMLEDEGERPKGIDAFFRPDDDDVPKNGKGKKKARHANTQLSQMISSKGGSSSGTEDYMQSKFPSAPAFLEHRLTL
jgi:hypothetical protein